MALRSVTKDIPKLSLRASFEPSTVDKDKRTVEVTWTTGARVMRGFWSNYWEELSLDPKHVRMGRLESGGAPFLAVHRGYDLDDVIGVVESAKLEKGRGTAVIRFDKGPKGDDAFRKVCDGILKNVSVGYSTYRMEMVEDGDDTTPVYRAVDWEPHEISLVPIGADAAAVVRSADGVTRCEFIAEERAVAKTESKLKTPITIEAPEGTEVTVRGESEDEDEESEDSEETEEAEERSDDDATKDEKKSEERARVLGIQRIGRKLNRPEKEVDAAIARGTSLSAYRKKAIDGVAEAKPEEGGNVMFKRNDPRIEAGKDVVDKRREAATNWILLRAGLGQLMTEAAKKRGEKLDLDPGEYRGMSLREMARDSLEATGVRTRGMDIMAMVGQSFVRIGPGLQSTSDFPVVLENALNKVLLAAYDTTPDTWRRFAKKGSVSDFRPHPRYRQGSFGVLDTVLEGGEFKNAAIPDAEKASISAGTKGRIIGITRQAIINDDMGAFSDLAERLGRAAALTIEVDVYALLALNSGMGPTMADGNPLFHASHNNIGAGAALSVASIDADRVVMGSQKDVSQNELVEMRPEVLLVALGLGGQARVINGAQFDVDAKANARNQEPNRVVGLYKDIVDTARLSGTRRYSFANPNQFPVIEVVFLNGNEQPYLEMKEGWRIDGTEWKVRLDSGVGAVDWRGAVTNAGV